MPPLNLFSWNEKSTVHICVYIVYLMLENQTTGKRNIYFLVLIFSYSFLPRSLKLHNFLAHNVYERVWLHFNNFLKIFHVMNFWLFESWTYFVNFNTVKQLDAQVNLYRLPNYIRPLRMSANKSRYLYC